MRTFRASYTDIVTLASSIVSSIQLPDASGVGLFNAPEKPRQRRYQLLDGEYTYVYRFTLGRSQPNGTLVHTSSVTIPLRCTILASSLIRSARLLRNGPVSFKYVLDQVSRRKSTDQTQWLLHIPGVYTELHINPAVYGEVRIKKDVGVRPSMICVVASQTVLPIQPAATTDLP